MGQSCATDDVIFADFVRVACRSELFHLRVSQSRSRLSHYARRQIAPEQLLELLFEKVCRTENAAYSFAGKN